MKTLFFIRHGENYANVIQAFSNYLYDYSLTDKGRLQAEQTAKYMKNQYSAIEKIDCIISSPLKRTLQTAKYLRNELGLEVRIDDNFRELHIGSLEHEASRENWMIFQQVLGSWESGNCDISFPDGESFTDLKMRITKGIENILKLPFKRIVVVTHGGILTHGLQVITQHSDDGYLFEHPNCAISQIEIDNDLSCRVLQWGKSNHLHGAASAQVK